MLFFKGPLWLSQLKCPVNICASSGKEIIISLIYTQQSDSFWETLKVVQWTRCLLCIHMNYLKIGLKIGLVYVL